jgi:hypothetical protein
VKFVEAEAPPGRVRPAPAAESLSIPTARADRSSPSASPEKTAAEKAGSVRLDKESFKDDPLIKQALEIFKGQIVEVRA